MDSYLVDAASYRCLVGKLIYLTSTKHVISYSVRIVINSCKNQGALGSCNENTAIY